MISEDASAGLTVQGVVIGLLLILSILLPNGLVQLSGVKRLDRRSILAVLIVVILFALFFGFFFWSRAPVLIGG